MVVFWRRLIVLSSGVPWAYLAIALLAPTPARAGCDYPTHIQHTTVDSVRDRSDLSRPLSDTQPLSKPCACTGPTCTRSPLTPPPSSSVESVKVSERGQLASRLPFVPTQSERAVGDEPIQPPSLPPSPIYHPPRLAS